MAETGCVGIRNQTHAWQLTCMGRSCGVRVSPVEQDECQSCLDHVG